MLGLGGRMKLAKQRASESPTSVNNVLLKRMEEKLTRFHHVIRTRLLEGLNCSAKVACECLVSDPVLRGLRDAPPRASAPYSGILTSRNAPLLKEVRIPVRVYVARLVYCTCVYLMRIWTALLKPGTARRCTVELTKWGFCSSTEWR